MRRRQPATTGQPRGSRHRDPQHGRRRSKHRPARGPGHPGRAGLETAPKAETRHRPDAVDQWRRDAERRRAQVDQMLDDMDGDDGADDLDEDTDA